MLITGFACRGREESGGRASAADGGTRKEIRRTQAEESGQREKSRGRL